LKLWAAIPLPILGGHIMCQGHPHPPPNLEKPTKNKVNLCVTTIEESIDFSEQANSNLKPCFDYLRQVASTFPAEVTAP
jgi:hypothetical protein